MLGQMLREAGLPYALLRRRSSPREEPRIRAWLTWLALAHPDWQVTPAPFDVAEALTLSIDGLDPARAALLTDQLYRDAVNGDRYSVNGEPYSLNDGVALGDPAALPASVVARVGAEMVALVAELRDWLLGQTAVYPSTTPCTTSFHCSPSPIFGRSRIWRARPFVTGWSSRPCGCARRPPNWGWTARPKSGPPSSRASSKGW
jgi:hypothetical protein